MFAAYFSKSQVANILPFKMAKIRNSPKDKVIYLMVSRSIPHKLELCCSFITVCKGSGNLCEKDIDGESGLGALGIYIGENGTLKVV